MMDTKIKDREQDEWKVLMSQKNREIRELHDTIYSLESQLRDLKAKYDAEKKDFLGSERVIKELKDLITQITKPVR